MYSDKVTLWTNDLQLHLEHRPQKTVFKCLFGDTCGVFSSDCRRGGGAGGWGAASVVRQLTEAFSSQQSVVFGAFLGAEVTHGSSCSTNLLFSLSVAV